MASSEITIRFISGRFRKLKADSATVKDGVLVLYEYTQNRRAALRSTETFPVKTIESAQMADGSVVYGEFQASLSAVVEGQLYWHPAAHSTLAAMNDREFREHLTAKRLERQRQEAAEANAAPKKPPAMAKPRKSGKTRSA